MAFKAGYPGYGWTIAVSSGLAWRKIWRGNRVLPRPSKVKAFKVKAF
jgi:hypothetical protein